MELEMLTGEPVTDPAELARVIAHIVRETDRWNQGSWWGGSWWKDGNEVSVTDARDSLKAPSCGTTGCVAGWAVILHAPVGSLIDIGDNVILPSGHSVYAESYGAEALNLSSREAAFLFAAFRTQEQVLYVLDAIAEGRDWSPDDAPDDPPGGCPCGCDSLDDLDEDESQDDE
jgi:hypothetical protein